MPQWLHDRLDNYKKYIGFNLLRTQLLFLAISLGVSAIQFLLLHDASLVSTILYTFFSGNIVTILLALAGPIFEDQPFPRDERLLRRSLV